MLKKKLILSLVVLLVLTSLVTAKSSENFEIKWKYPSNNWISDIAISDLENDGYPDVFVSYLNGSIYVIDRYGHLKKDYFIGNVTQIGKISSIQVTDINDDSVNEIVLGLSEKREVSKPAWEEYYNNLNKSVERKTKILFRTLRNTGSVLLLSINGTHIWNYTINDSVRALYAYDVNGDGKKEIISGVGFMNIDSYYELTGTDKKGEIWELIDYLVQNGSVYLLDNKGKTIWEFEIPSTDGDINKNVRSVYSADINKDGYLEILAGSSNGFLYVINLTGPMLWKYNASEPVMAISAGDINNDRSIEVVVGTNNGMIHAISSSGNLIWKYRIDGGITNIKILDLYGTGSNEIIVSSSDKHLYIFNGDGELSWRYFTSEPVYSFQVSDLDLNGYNEIIIASDKNVTSYELREPFVKRLQADQQYETAEIKFKSQQYTEAMIHAQKARMLYLDIKDFDDLPKTDILISKILEEYKLVKKKEATSLYEKALGFYGVGNYTFSLILVQEAKKIFSEVNDTDGISKSDTLISRIRGEIRVYRTMEADSNYAKALSYYNFGNYTASLYYARISKEIYAELEHYNGTLKSELLITNMADSYYNKAELYYNAMDYEKALNYANSAKEIYTELKNSNGTAKTELLIDRINQRENIPIGTPRKDYMPIVYGAIGVIILLLIASFLKKRRKLAEEGIRL